MFSVSESMATLVNYKCKWTFNYIKEGMMAPSILGIMIMINMLMNANTIYNSNNNNKNNNI